MAVIGVICEYDPFHRGHAWHLAQARRRVGEKSQILCVMSGEVTQRGDFAQWDKFARTQIALAAGADVVLELPPARAAAPARNFARGAVGLLQATGVVTHLAFGSESGDLPGLQALAQAEQDHNFAPLLRRELAAGKSYAAARQTALEQLAGPAGALLSQANDTLAVEYLRACQELGTDWTPVAIRRRGAGHNGEPAGEFASGSALRKLLSQGAWEQAARYLTPEGYRCLRQEADGGRGPASLMACPGALYLLRQARREAFDRLPDSTPEMASRLWRAARQAESMEEFLRLSCTRRFPLARVRRAALHLALGLTRQEMEQKPSFLRLLGFSTAGQALLGEMRKRALLPVLSRPGGVKTMGAGAQAEFEAVVRAADLRQLAISGGKVEPGFQWKRQPVRWGEKT